MPIPFYSYHTITDVCTTALLPTKPSSDDDSGFLHDFGSEASLPLAQSIPAVSHDTTRLCQIVVTLWDCHINADADKSLIFFSVDATSYKSNDSFFLSFFLFHFLKSACFYYCWVDSWFTYLFFLFRCGKLQITEFMFSFFLSFFLSFKIVTKKKRKRSHFPFFLSFILFIYFFF